MNGVYANGAPSSDIPAATATVNKWIIGEVARTRDTQSCVVGYICEVPLFRPFEWD